MIISPVRSTAQPAILRNKAGTVLRALRPRVPLGKPAMPRDGVYVAQTARASAEGLQQSSTYKNIVEELRAMPRNDYRVRRNTIERLAKRQAYLLGDSEFASAAEKIIDASKDFDAIFQAQVLQAISTPFRRHNRIVTNYIFHLLQRAAQDLPAKSRSMVDPIPSPKN